MKIGALHNVRAIQRRQDIASEASAPQRCLVAADYWIEWQRGDGARRPFAIRRAEAIPFFFTGIWSNATRLPDDHPASSEPVGVARLVIELSG